MRTTKDVRGRTVKEGDKVRVLSIDAGYINSLEPEEKQRVRSMIGGVLVVDEIDEHGYAMVERWWRDGPDCSTGHTVALSENEMELVESAA